jgi:hypothetical protein
MPTNYNWRIEDDLPTASVWYHSLSDTPMMELTSALVHAADHHAQSWPLALPDGRLGVRTISLNWTSGRNCWVGKNRLIVWIPRRVLNLRVMGMIVRDMHNVLAMRISLADIGLVYDGTDSLAEDLMGHPLLSSREIEILQRIIPGSDRIRVPLRDLRFNLEWFFTKMAGRFPKRYKPCETELPCLMRN